MAHPDREDLFFRRLIAAVAVVLLSAACIFAVFRTSHVLLILFAGILGGLFLDGVARPLQRFLGIPRFPAILLAAAVLVLAALGFGFMLGPQLLDQSAQLADLLSESVSRLRGWIESKPLSGLLTETSRAQLTAIPAELFRQVSGVFSSLFGFLATVLIVSVLALYLAIQPEIYVKGLVLLLPPGRRARGEEVLGAVGHALRWWLVGRAVSMTAVAILTLVGLWLIGLKAALALAVIAGVFSFVPYFGPIAATVPALLISLGDLPWAPFWVAVVYSVVQFLEGNLVTPLVQQRAVALPPVVLVVAQLGAGVLFGLLGILLATPLAVTTIVLVQMLYIQDVLEEPVQVLGQHGGER